MNRFSSLLLVVALLLPFLVSSAQAAPALPYVGISATLDSNGDTYPERLDGVKITASPVSGGQKVVKYLNYSSATTMRLAPGEYNLTVACSAGMTCTANFVVTSEKYQHFSYMWR